jgi:putative copper resistance protein D
MLATGYWLLATSASFSIRRLSVSWVSCARSHLAVVLLCVAASLIVPGQVKAEESAVPHTHHAQEGAPHEQHPAGLTVHEEHAAGHHMHREPVLPPDEDQAFSELNHHIAGVFVFFAGGLALLAASGSRRYAWARYGWPGLFFCLGLFLFVRHDPESWPWGALPLWESMTDPQVLQHVLFTLIVLGIGTIEWLRCRGTLTHTVWGLIFPALAIAAAVMLFLHKHGSGLEAEKIYRHHSIMAFAGIAAMLAKVLDDSRLLRNRAYAYLWPGLMMFVGFMLLIYSE